MAGLADDRQQVGAVAQPAVVAERRPQPDALAAEVLADQVRGERELLAERDRRRLGEDRLGVGAEGAVAHVTEDDVAVGVLLDVVQG